MADKPDIAEEGLIALLKISKGLPLTTDYERGVADGMTLALRKPKKIDCPHTKKSCVEYCTREPGGCMHGVPYP